MMEIPNIVTGALLPAIYLLYQVPLLAASALTARRFEPRNRFEYLTAAGFLYVLWTTAIPGILGLFGALTQESVFCAAWIAGAVVWVIERSRPRHALPPFRFSAPEIILLALFAGFIGYQWRAYGVLPPIGTDAMMYHLYYPAVWSATGTIERLTLPGYLTAAYPCYGEILYAWQILSFNGDFFVKNWQFYFLLLGVCATVSLALAARCRRIAALGAGLLTAFTGVVFRNATVTDTDIVTGSFLLTGIVFLFLGVRRNRTGWLLLAGAGFGMAAGTKYLGFLLAPPALLLIAASAWFYRPACRKKLLWCLATAVAVGSPCFIANWVVYGNPFFPARIGFGEWVLFPAYMDLHAPAIGWTRQAWSFFVNDESNSVSFIGAIMLLVFVCAATAARLLPLRTGKREFRNWVFPTLGGSILLLLALQLKLYPSMTQPRQIIPLAMLAAACAAVPLDALAKFRLFRSGWSMAAVIAVLLFLASAPQFQYATHGRPVLFCAGVAALLLLAFSRLKRRGRIVLFVLVTAVFLLDAGYRYGLSRTAAETVRTKLISPADEAVRQILEREAGKKGGRILYCGSYFYNFIGDYGQHTLLLIPVTASGEPDYGAYRTLEEARAPGSYELWLDRLQKAEAEFLLVDRNSFVAPNPRLELDWALAHPETFVKRFDAGGLTLFSIRRPR